MESSGNVRRILRNSVLTTGSLLVGGVTLFVTFVVIARYLSVERLGDFVLCLTLVSILQLFADGGIVNITVRDIAQQPERQCEILSSTRGLVWTTSVVLAVLVFLVSLLAVSDGTFRTALYLMCGAGLCALQGAVYTGVVRAHEDMGIIAVAAVAQKVLLLALVGVVIVSDGKLEGIALATLVSNAVHWGFFVVVVRFRYTTSRLKIDREHWFYLTREAVPLGASMVLRKLSVHTGTFLLAALANAATVGLYNSAYRVLQMIEVAALGIAGVLLPPLAKAKLTSIEAFIGLYGGSMRLLVVVSAPVAGLLLGIGPHWIVVLYGDAYKEAGEAIRVLGVALVFLVPGALLHSVFAALGEQRRLMRVATFGVAVNCVVGLLLIPRMQAMGAAVATLVTECSTLIAGAYYLHTLKVRMPYLTTWLSSMLPAGVVAFVVANLTDWSGVTRAIAGSLLYSIGYFMLVLATGVLRPSELRVLRESIRGPSREKSV